MECDYLFSLFAQPAFNYVRLDYKTRMMCVCVCLYVCVFMCVCVSALIITASEIFLCYYAMLRHLPGTSTHFLPLSPPPPSLISFSSSSLSSLLFPRRFFFHLLRHRSSHPTSSYPLLLLLLLSVALFLIPLFYDRISISTE